MVSLEVIHFQRFCLTLDITTIPLKFFSIDNANPQLWFRVSVTFAAADGGSRSYSVQVINSKAC
ncbi:hypothetical protein Peur_062152 [Populus x canadensis]